MKTLTRRGLKTAVAATMAGGLVILHGGAASAHVHVAPDNTAEGSYAQLTFKVPNESETAKTTQVKVELPAETPFNAVSVKPLEGWTAEVVNGELPTPVSANGATITKAARFVIWTADDTHPIGTHEYQTFSISVGVLPKAGTEVALPAWQTYSDGSIVKWDQKAAEGQDDPKNPAPSFTTTVKAAGHAHRNAASPDALVSSTEEDGTSRSIDWGFVAGWTGLIAGMFGLGAGIVALARTRGLRAG